MICYNGKEFKIEDIETSFVILTYPDLFEQRFTKYVNGYAFKACKQIKEVAKHQLTDIDLPVELNE